MNVLCLCVLLCHCLLYSAHLPLHLPLSLPVSLSPTPSLATHDSRLMTSCSFYATHESLDVIISQHAEEEKGE